MKRINPESNVPFKRGDIREDGYIFNKYSSTKKADGYFKEIWLNPEVFERNKKRETDKKKASYTRTTDRYPKGTKWYFKRDHFADLAYKAAMKYMLENPDWTQEDMVSITDLAPYVLKIIFPDPQGIDIHSIFINEGAENLAFYQREKELKKIRKKLAKTKNSIPDPMIW
jgi:hypothetical protein